jgi:hypothetical protein
VINTGQGDCATLATAICKQHPGCAVVSFNSVKSWITLKKAGQSNPALTGGGSISYGKKLSAKEIAAIVEREGWASSEVSVTPNQAMVGKTAQCPGMYNGNCSMQGENLLGRCFCVPGFTGKHCEQTGPKPQCTNKDDRCFYSEEAGEWGPSEQHGPFLYTLYTL